MSSSAVSYAASETESEEEQIPHRFMPHRTNDSFFICSVCNEYVQEAISRCAFCYMTIHSKCQTTISEEICEGESEEFEKKNEETTNTIRDLMNICNYAPKSVLKHIVEIYDESIREKEDLDILRLLKHSGKPFMSVIMFADISGFTKLSTALIDLGEIGIEELSHHLDAYFDQVMAVVEEYGGDTVKIAGDAVMVVWETSEQLLMESICRSLMCALKLVNIEYKAKIQAAARASEGSRPTPIVAISRARSTMSVASDNSDLSTTGSIQKHWANSGMKDVQKGVVSDSVEVVTLKLHCGISFGEIFGVHVGGVRDRMEYLIVDGNSEDLGAISAVASCAEDANPGEVVVSSRIYDMILQDAQLGKKIFGEPVKKKNLGNISTEEEIEEKNVTNIRVTFGQQGRKVLGIRLGEIDVAVAAKRRMSVADTIAGFFVGKLVSSQGSAKFTAVRSRVKALTPQLENILTTCLNSSDI